MVHARRVAATAANILCFGLTLVTIESLTTVKFSYRRSINLRESHRSTSTRSYKDRSTTFRLFSISDFSSHPYSVYYGASGSTAKQNFGQNDDVNDVYGYNPDSRGRDEPYDDRRNRGLRSMQDNPLMDGRRGARVFSGKYDEDFYGDYRLADEGDSLFHEERLMEDQHMMNRMDSILYERDHLKRQLDSVVNENIYLQNQYEQNQHNINCDPQCMPEGENQNCPPTNPISGSMHTNQNQATKSAIDSVMDELKNMQRTVQAVEAEQRGRNTIEAEDSINSSTMKSESSTVASIKYDLQNMEQELQNLYSEQEKVTTNSNGPDPPMGEIARAENFNGSTSTSVSQRQSNAVSRLEHSRADNMMSDNDLDSSEHTTHSFNGEYEVVIKAELKKKNSFEGTRDPVEKQIDVSRSPESGKPYSVGESFGSKYI